MTGCNTYKSVLITELANIFPLKVQLTLSPGIVENLVIFHKANAVFIVTDNKLKIPRHKVGIVNSDKVHFKRQQIDFMWIYVDLSLPLHDIVTLTIYMCVCVCVCVCLCVCLFVCLSLCLCL